MPDLYDRQQDRLDPSMVPDIIIALSS